MRYQKRVKRRDRILKKLRILLLILAVTACMECTGCTSKKQASDQGELVQNERLPENEKSGSLYCWKPLRLSKKMVR